MLFSVLFLWLAEKAMTALNKIGQSRPFWGTNVPKVRLESLRSYQGASVVI